MGTEPRAITVLVVDDEDDIRTVVRLLLESNGMQVVGQALDGLDALIAVARLAPPPTPTVIVVDLVMPALSGLEVARQILTQIPEQLIVLFSAHLTRDIIRQANDLGITACVAKADVALLPAVINELVTPAVDLREETANPSRTLP